MTAPVLKLGAVTLPSDLNWVDQNDWDPVGMESRRTIGGRMLYASNTLTGGRPITLASYADGAWFTDAQVAAIRSLAEDPDATHTLQIDTSYYTVIFNWEDGPAASFRTPDSAETQNSFPSGTGWWVGELKLLEIA